MKSEKDFYRQEWQIAKKKGQMEWAKTCKEMYRLCVMEEMQRPHWQIEDSLKQHPFLCLN